MAECLENIRSVKIVAKRDLNFERLGIRVFKDVETEVPRWLAEILEEEGVCEVLKESPEIIGEKLYREKVSILFAELPQGTFHMIRDIIRRSPEDSLIRRDAIELVNRRLGKLMDYLKASILLTSKKPPKNLLVEELILYNALKSVIEEWMRSFVGVRVDR
jgi:DNA replication initiation complex subunit (GINS family)